MNIKAIISNRLSRKHYLLGSMFFGFLTYILIGIPILFLTSNSAFSQGIALLAFFPFLVILANRRCHDMGASGKYYFVFATLNLFYNLIFIRLLNTTISTVLSSIFGIMSFGIGIALLFTSGEVKENRYGEPTDALPFFEALFPKDFTKYKTETIVENKSVTKNNKLFFSGDSLLKRHSIVKVMITVVTSLGILLVAGSTLYYLVLRPMHNDNELGRCLERVQTEHYKKGEKAMQFYRENCFKQYK